VKLDLDTSGKKAVLNVSVARTALNPWGDFYGDPTFLMTRTSSIELAAP
jgi:hypothetical protein